MLLDQIFSSMTSVFEADPLTIFVLLVITSLFLWLTKEIRLHLDKERNWQQNEIRKSLEVFSKILVEGEKYKTTKNLADFYEAVYSSIPFIEHQLVKEILAEINHDTKNNEEKVLGITELVQEKMSLLSAKNKIYSTSKFLFEDVEKFFSRLWKIIEPSILSFFIIYSALFVWLITYAWENQFWIMIKLICLFMSFMLTVLTGDLIIKSEKINGPTTLFGLSAILSFMTVITSEKNTWIPLSLFLILIVSAIYFGTKDKKDYETVSTSEK